MTNISKILFSLFFLICSANISYSKENFFNDGLKLFNEKKYDDAKFLFERSIVFDPNHADSYLYLAKIYKEQEDQKKKKNLEATLLIDPKNEEAILMLMKLE